MTKKTISPAEWAAWRSFRRMAEVISGRIVHDISHATGLSSADFVVLMELNKAEDACRRQRDLQAYLEWDKTRLSHQLTRMAGRNLIERGNDRENAVTIRMTPEGHRQLAAASPVHTDSVRKNFLNHLSSDDLEKLQDVTRKLHSALQDLES
ncbi:MarR family winged helix-turn-helix transcriptional regulator [Frateuria aurantia]